MKNGDGVCDSVEADHDDVAEEATTGDEARRARERSKKGGRWRWWRSSGNEDARQPTTNHEECK